MKTIFTSSKLPISSAIFSSRKATTLVLSQFSFLNTKESTINMKIKTTQTSLIKVSTNIKLFISTLVFTLKVVSILIATFSYVSI